ncbi:MAG: hypothetical protein M1281_20315 [Chloroflexi bacterium]|nr:hypothetical protein [Chloroflexota bacterium]
MADDLVSRNLPKNPDPQEKPVSGDDITPSEEQQIILNKPPKSLVDWLVRVHLRLIALENEKANDSS